MAPNHRDRPTSLVCVCEAPRFTGGCSCDRNPETHLPNECRACHRPVLTLTEDSE